MRNFTAHRDSIALADRCARPRRTTRTRPAIDPNAPRVHITSPARGTFAGDVETIDGHRHRDRRQRRSPRSRSTASPRRSPPTARSRATVPVTPGTNLLHAIAKDAQGNTGKEIARGRRRPDGDARRAGPARRSPRRCRRRRSMRSAAAPPAFIDDRRPRCAVVAPMNPVVDVGARTAPDCLYGQARDHRASTSATPTSRWCRRPAALLLDASSTTSRVDMHLQWAVACLDGSRDIAIAAQQIRVSGMLERRHRSAGDFDIKLDEPERRRSPASTSSSAACPQTIIDLLDLDTAHGPDPRLGDRAVRRADAQQRRSPASTRPRRSTCSARTVDIDVKPSQHRLRRSTGAHGHARHRRCARRATARRASSTSRTRSRRWTCRHGFQLAVADDAANQLLDQLVVREGHRPRRSISRPARTARSASSTTRSSSSAKVPPFVDASGDALELTVGDLIATFKNGELDRHAGRDQRAGRAQGRRRRGRQAPPRRRHADDVRRHPRRGHRGLEPAVERAVRGDRLVRAVARSSRSARARSARFRCPRSAASR